MANESKLLETPLQKARGTMKTKTQLVDDSIMGTNNSSIVSKRSVERLYFANESHFFRIFVKKPQRRAPLINRGYWLRMKAIDHVVRQYLDQDSKKRTVVVNLGCGYDPLPWQCLHRYPKSSNGALFIDVDYRELMLKKRAMVLATDQLKSYFSNIKTEETETLLLSDEYIQMGCDLRDLSLLDRTLRRVVDLDNARIIFVAEVSITYMDKDSADSLISWASTLPEAKFCLLEQLMPAGGDHPFAKTMMAHFNKLGTPLHSVRRYPSTSHQEARFRSLGWKYAIARNLWNMWSSPDFLNDDERRSLDLVEPFDEWEEFALFGSHYVLLVASTIEEASSEVVLPLHHLHIAQQLPTVSLVTRVSEHPKGKGLNRFASAIPVHSSKSTTNYHFGVFGGMTSATRVDTIDVYGRDQNRTYGPINHLTTVAPSARMSHTTTDLGDSGTLLVGGRASPDNAFADCWLYHKYLDIWERVDDIPSPRYRHQTLSLGNGHVLVTPGRSNSKLMASTFLIWHRTTGWVECVSGGLVPLPTFGSVAFVAENSTMSRSSNSASGVLAGGLSDSGVVQGAVWKWEVTELTSNKPVIDFEQVKENASLSLLARFGASVTSLNGIAFVVGGIVKDQLLEESYDICTVQLNDLAIRGVTVDTETPIRPLLVGTTIVAYPDTLVITGGSAVCFSFGTFWNNRCSALAISSVFSDRGDPDIETRNNNPTTWSYQETRMGVTPMKAIDHEQKALGNPRLRNAPIDVSRTRLHTTADFKALLEVGKPVIIEGSNIGTCTSTWTEDYLKKQLGDRDVVVHEASTAEMNFVNKNFDYKTMKFQDFMAKVSQGGRLYLRSLSANKPSDLPANLATDFPTLASDFSLPPALEFVRENAHSSPLRISAGVNMWLHYDVMANVLCQVHGCKRLLLFPPSDVKYFGFEPGSSSSSVDVFNNLDQHPGVLPYEVLLKPGDILYLPALWLHAASPLAGMSISVNVFFRSLQSGYSAGRDVYGNRDLQAYEKGRQDIQKISRSFDGLPADVRGFYLQRLVDELQLKI